jgi:hypothetical protein
MFGCIRSDEVDFLERGPSGDTCGSGLGGSGGLCLLNNKLLYHRSWNTSATRHFVRFMNSNPELIRRERRDTAIVDN